MLAILDRAIRDILDSVPKHDFKYKRDAYRWLFESLSRKPFSYRWICEYLDLPPSLLRSQVDTELSRQQSKLVAN